MTKKEVLRNVLNLLSNELSSFDFKLILKEQGFIRKEKSFIYLFFILIYDRTNIDTGEKGFKIEPFANISILDIENFYKNVTLNNYLKTEWDFITLGNSIAELKANPDGIHKKWNESLDLFIFYEKDIQIVSNELIKQFKNFALPYFNTNNTVKRVDQLFNEHPRRYSVHMSNDLFRFIKGLIAAKLVENPNFSQLLNIYSDLLVERNMPIDCLEEMDRLKSILHLIKKDSA